MTPDHRHVDQQQSYYQSVQPKHRSLTQTCVLKDTKETNSENKEKLLFLSLLFLFLFLSLLVTGHAQPSCDLIEYDFISSLSEVYTVPNNSLVRLIARFSNKNLVAIHNNLLTTPSLPVVIVFPSVATARNQRLTEPIFLRVSKQLVFDRVDIYVSNGSFRQRSSKLGHGL